MLSDYDGSTCLISGSGSTPAKVDMATIRQLVNQRPFLDTRLCPPERYSRWTRRRALLTVVRDFTYSVGEMAGTPSLGEFEQIVLLAILRLGKDAYGVTIRSEIQSQTGRIPTSGALYTTLDRLEDKGLLESQMGEPTPQRGGRAKRFFDVTSNGLQAVARAQQSYKNLTKGLQLPGLGHA